MKKIPIFTVCFLVCTIMCSCIEYTIYCGKIREKIMFVPQNVEINDSIILYSNKGDFLKYSISKKAFNIAEEEFTSNCKCSCYDYFELEFINSTYPKLDINNIRYYFGLENYKSEKEAINNPVYVTISVDSFKYSFRYNLKECGTLNSVSATLHDSLIINEVCYYDVVELNNSGKSIHVAKNFGVVQITKEDGEIWTLNEWNNVVEEDGAIVDESDISVEAYPNTFTESFNQSNVVFKLIKDQ